MNIEDQLIFFLSALGVFNGVLLVLYLFFFLKPRRWINILFGLLVLMLCIRIGKSVLHIFTDINRTIRQIGLSACLLVGPLTLLYIKRFITQSKSPKKSDWWQIYVPFIAIVITGVIWPYETSPEIWNSTIVKVIYGSWLIYMIITGYIAIPYAAKAAKEKQSIKAIWVLLVFSSIFLMCIAYIFAYSGEFPYLSGPILFSIVFYLLVGFLLKKSHRQTVLYEQTIKYKKQKIATTDADKILDQLSQLMNSKQLYLNPKLKLAEIAKSITASPNDVSQVINDRLGVSFNHYINEFRINAACEMLKDNDHFTIEGIGLKAGFSSRSAFYQAFKSFKNQTPAQYKSQIRKKTF